MSHERPNDRRQREGCVGSSRAAGSQGQAMVVVALAGLALLVVLSALLATLGGVVNDRARARTAADAAALAGAASGRDAAEAAARANGGAVEDFRVDGDRTTVTVRVGRARATSTAARAWRDAATRVVGFLFERGDHLHSS